jgi:hypothetical protein
VRGAVDALVRPRQPSLEMQLECRE